MFSLKKFGRGIGLSKGGDTGIKYNIDVQVVSVDGLPDAVKKCRVVMARGAKISMTDVKDTRAGTATFKQTLTQVSTIQKKGDDYENKEFTFKVQVPGSSMKDDFMTIGKADIDMADFVDDQLCQQNRGLAMQFKVGLSKPTGVVRLIITTKPLGRAASEDDGMTEVSGVTGLTSEAGNQRREEQDLKGFDDKKSKKSQSSKRGEEASSARKQLPSTKEEDSHPEEEKEEEEEEVQTVPTKPATRAKAAAAAATAPSASNSRKVQDQPSSFEDPGSFAKKKAPALKKKPVYEDDDDDISPMNSDLDDSPQRPVPSYKAQSGAATVAASAASSGASGSKSKSLLGLMKPKSKQVEAPAPEPPKPSRPLQPSKEEQQEEFSKGRAALFSTTPSTAASGKKGSSTVNVPTGTTVKRGSSNRASEIQDEEEEEARAAAPYASTSKGSVNKAMATKATSKPSVPPDAEDEEDEDAMRNSLLSAPAKKGMKVPKTAPRAATVEAEEDEEPSPRQKASTSKGASKRATVAASAAAVIATMDEQGEEDEDVSRAALFSAPSKKKTAAAAAAGKKTLDGMPVAAMRKQPSKSAGAAASQALSYEEGEEQTAVAASTSAPSKSSTLKSAAAASASMGGAALGVAVGRGREAAGNDQSQAELEQLRIQVSELQQKLEASQQREAKLTRQLDEMDVDPQELFTQMHEMEHQHASQIKDAEEHIAMLEYQLKNGGQGGGGQESSAELEEREAAIAEREAAVAEREAAVQEREAAVSEREMEMEAREVAMSAERRKLAADLVASKARIDEANKMADESMILAVQHSQEKKAMAEEIENLKAQLAAESSHAETSHSKGRSGYGADDYDDDHDDPYDNAGGASHAAQLTALQTQLEQLQLENAELTKQCDSVRVEAQQLLDELQEFLSEQLSSREFKGGLTFLGGLPAAVAALLDQYNRAIQESQTLRSKVSSMALDAEAARALETSLQAAHEQLQSLQAQQAERESTQKEASSSTAADIESIDSSSILSGVVQGSDSGAKEGQQQGRTSWGAEKEALLAQVSELQAQVVELQQADTIISEWSAYADSLVAERDAIRHQLEEAQAAAAANVSAGTALQADREPDEEAVSSSAPDTHWDAGGSHVVAENVAESESRELEALHMAHAELLISMEEVQHALEEAEARIQVLEQELEAARHSRGNQGTKMEASEKTETGAEEDAGAMLELEEERRKCGELEALHEGLVEQYNVLKDQYESLVQELNQTSVQHDEAVMELNQLKMEYDQLQVHRDQLQAKHEQVVLELEGLREAHEGVLQDHRELKEMHAGLVQQYGRAMEDLESLQQEHDELLQQHISMQQKEGELREGHESLLREYDEMCRRQEEATAQAVPFPAAATAAAAAAGLTLPPNSALHLDPTHAILAYGRSNEPVSSEPAAPGALAGQDWDHMFFSDQDQDPMLGYSGQHQTEQVLHYLDDPADASSQSAGYYVGVQQEQAGAGLQLELEELQWKYKKLQDNVEALQQQLLEALSLQQELEEARAELVQLREGRRFEMAGLDVTSLAVTADMEHGSLQSSERIGADEQDSGLKVELDVNNSSLLLDRVNRLSSAGGYPLLRPLEERRSSSSNVSTSSSNPGTSNSSRGARLTRPPSSSGASSNRGSAATPVIPDLRGASFYDVTALQQERESLRAEVRELKLKLQECEGVAHERDELVGEVERLMARLAAVELLKAGPQSDRRKKGLLGSSRGGSSSSSMADTKHVNNSSSGSSVIVEEGGAAAAAAAGWGSRIPAASYIVMYEDSFHGSPSHIVTGTAAAPTAAGFTAAALDPASESGFEHPRSESPSIISTAMSTAGLLSQHEDFATLSELKNKLSLLTAWRGNAETTLLALQSELQIVKLDRDEALQACAAAKKQAAKAEARAAAAAAAREKHSPDAARAEGAVASQSAVSSVGSFSRYSLPHDLGGRPTYITAASSSTTGAQQGSRSTLEELSRMRDELLSVAAVVFATRRTLAGCLALMSAVEAASSHQVQEGQALDVAVIKMKDEALNLFQELQRQARNTTKYESQVQAASQRVTELEHAMEQLQLENQRLLAFSSVEQSSSLQAAYDKLPYGTDSSLSLSAMEQQLSVAEQEVADLHDLLGRMGREKQQLAAEVQDLEIAVAAARKDFSEAVTVFEAASGMKAQDVLSKDLIRKAKRMSQDGLDRKGGRSKSRSRGGRAMDMNEEDTLDDDDPAAARRAAREKALLQRDLTHLQNENVDLAAKVEKLEAMLDDLEAQLHQSTQLQEATEAELEEMREKLKQTEAELSASMAAAAAATYKKGSEVSASEASYRRDIQQLQDHVSDLELQLRHLSLDKTALEADLQEAKSKESVGGAAAAGGDAAAAASALAKYNKLKERYKMLEETSQEEIDELADQLQEAQDHIKELEAEVSALQKQSSSGRSRGGNSRELEEVREERDRLVNQLVAKQMELAQMSEDEAMLKRELTRAKEVNLKLAAKMTKLEAEVFANKAAAGRK
ncbi:hypothetical protein CEUSTIGMA_g6018.t1 [Chlamydomonas eustigma]|uniref:C2 NT-type domain-containing protein n=1 Tax=Chlamydomonas eustigma TaxID=1157962 RepID=A0A250X6N0_9CHLO|nr:hypothetical protein CEUSTIGMA_g6018.t1 [Chlamydomonas eustigma]|eukprot:GAX78579.1 hypothetical protein CEUSTIGMA_g6018.t1 [Chlamydomonas eustigma]